MFEFEAWISMFTCERNHVVQLYAVSEVCIRTAENVETGFPNCAFKNLSTFIYKLLSISLSTNFYYLIE